MRVRTTEDVEKLDRKIKEDLGIDVQKYRNDEVAENFVEIIAFLDYVITWVIQPLLVAIGLYIAGFFFLDLVHVEYFIYGLIGLILFFVVGLLLGLLFLTSKMKADMWGIVNYSLEIMKSAVYDTNLVNNQVTKENRKDVLGLLFKGIIHIVTIPMMSAAISAKVPILGDFINRIVKRILMIVSDRVKFDEKILKQELRKPEDEPSAIQTYSNSITSVSSGLEKVLRFTFGIVRLPLKLGFGILFLILTLFLYLIN